MRVMIVSFVILLLVFTSMLLRVTSLPLKFKDVKLRGWLTFYMFGCQPYYYWLDHPATSQIVIAVYGLLHTAIFALGAYVIVHDKKLSIYG